MELAPCMGPAGDLIDGAIAVKMMEAGVGVCLKASLEVLQMSPWMLALAILRVRKPDGRSGIFSGRPVVADVGPEACRPGLATAGRKHGNRRVVGVKLASCEHVLLNRVDQGREQLTGSTYPTCQRRALNLNSLASVDLRLAIERQMIAELRDQHVGQQPWSGKTAFDRTRRRRCFNHAVAPVAGELRPHMANDLEAIRDVLQLLGDIFAELAQLAAAVGTRVAVKSVRHHFAREMFRQRLAPGSCLRFLCRGHAFHSGFHLGLRGLHLLPMEFKLFELKNDLLALDAEHPALQLLDDQLQMLDLLTAGTQFLILLGECLAMGLKLSLKRSKLVFMRNGKGSKFLLMRKEQRQQCLSIKRVEIRQRSGIHGRRM